MFHYLLFIAFALFASCHSTKMDPRYSQLHWERIRVENKLRLEKEGFYEVGGGIAFQSELTKVFGDYTTAKYCFSSIDEARKLYYQVFDEFAKSFPEIEREQIALGIIFVNAGNRPLEEPYIAMVRNTSGHVVYSFYDAKTKTYYPLHVEYVQK